MNPWYSVHHPPPAEHAARSILAACEERGVAVTIDAAAKIHLTPAGRLEPEIKADLAQLLNIPPVRRLFIDLAARGPSISDITPAGVRGPIYSKPDLSVDQTPQLPAGRAACPWCQRPSNLYQFSNWTWPANHYMIEAHSTPAGNHCAGSRRRIEAKKT